MGSLCQAIAATYTTTVIAGSSTVAMKAVTDWGALLKLRLLRVSNIRGTGSRRSVRDVAVVRGGSNFRGRGPASSLETAHQRDRFSFKNMTTLRVLDGVKKGDSLQSPQCCRT